MDNDFMNNLINNLKNSNNASNSSNDENTNAAINPDMLKNLMTMFNNFNNSNTNDDNNSNDSSTSNTASNSDNFNPNIDINMLLKIKSIMDKMNENKNDPRSNLLRSLKPYLKKSRQDKVEQYVQLFSMGKIINAFNQNGGENTK